ncbi:MAG: nucleoside triphosphate pyrophosphatase [Halioglobus sp.]
MDLILASSSTYRRQLLERLMLPFRCVAPDIDETALPDETPEALALRLSDEKAEAVAAHYHECLVIGSDQVASIEGTLLGKPGNHEVASEQLRKCSGRRVNFYTGLAVKCRQSEFSQRHVVCYSVEFRELSERTIDRYLAREQPYDCAGSFKCEGLGITLFRRMQGDDPTSLQGLPLISLSGILLDAGYNLYQ